MTDKQGVSGTPRTAVAEFFEMGQWLVTAEFAEQLERDYQSLQSRYDALTKEADKFEDGIDWIQRAMQAEARLTVVDKLVEALEQIEHIADDILCTTITEIAEAALKSVRGDNNGLSY